MSPKPESINPNPKINQDHLQVPQAIFASYLTRALNYFAPFGFLMRQGRRRGAVTKSFCWLVRMEKKHYEMRQSYTTFLSFDATIQTNRG